MFVRLAIALVALVVVVPVATVIAKPDWATAVGLDVWNLPALREENEAAAEHNRELEEETTEIKHRMEVKEALIRNLIAGRSTLAEVTNQFLELDQERPGYLTLIRGTYPAATDQESMAQNVVAYTWPRLGDEPTTRRFEVVVRLMSEFRDYADSADANATH